mgnify:CR=1 FL=1
MKFKMKGINTLINSPLAQTSSTGQTITNDKFTTNLAGEEIAIERTISQPGSTEGNTGVSFEESYNKLNDEQRKDYPDLASWKKYVEDYNANKNATEIKQERDYTQGLLTRPGEKYKGRYYKQREGWAEGYKDEAYETGDFLAGLITEGGGNGDTKNYITSNEAMELYKKYNKQIVRPNQPKPTDPNNFTSIRNWNNWRRQRGLDPATVSMQTGYTPTSYEQNENTSNWRNVNKNN